MGEGAKTIVCNFYLYSSQNAASIKLYNFIQCILHRNRFTRLIFRNADAFLVALDVFEIPLRSVCCGCLLFVIYCLESLLLLHPTVFFQNKIHEISHIWFGHTVRIVLTVFHF